MEITLLFIGTRNSVPVSSTYACHDYLTTRPLWNVHPFVYWFKQITHASYSYEACIRVMKKTSENSLWY